MSTFIQEMYTWDGKICGKASNRGELALGEVTEQTFRGQVSLHRLMFYLFKGIPLLVRS